MFVDDLAGAYNMVMAEKSFAFVPMRLSQLRIHANTYTGSREQHRSEDLLYRAAIAEGSPQERAILLGALARMQFSRGSRVLETDRAYAREQFRLAWRSPPNGLMPPTGRRSGGRATRTN